MFPVSRFFFLSLCFLHFTLIIIIWEIIISWQSNFDVVHQFKSHTFRLFHSVVVSWSVRPFVHPSVHPSICLSDRPSVHPSVSLSVCLSVHPSIHFQSVCLSVHQSIQWSIHPYNCPSVHPSFRYSLARILPHIP